MKKMGKKGMYGLNDLPGVALVFLVVGVLFALSLVVLSSLRDNSSISGDAEVAINNTIDAVSEIPNNWLGLIAVVIAAALVITIVVVALYKGVAGGFGGGRS